MTESIRNADPVALVSLLRECRRFFLACPAYDGLILADLDSRIAATLGDPTREQ
jgi:hypothetical protein